MLSPPLARDCTCHGELSTDIWRLYRLNAKSRLSLNNITCAYLIGDEKESVRGGAQRLMNVLYSDKPPEMEGFPMKLWNIEVFLLDEQENEHPAKVFTKAVYNLHPSFKNPTQSKSLFLLLLPTYFAKGSFLTSILSIPFSTFPLRERRLG